MTGKSTDTKVRILDAATHLFSCHGFFATSIDDILSAVGITKGAFYHYFKSKDHLCETVLDRAISEYQQLAQGLTESDSGPDPLRRWFAILIEKHDSGQWVYCRLLTRLSIESVELDAAIQNKLKTFWLWCESFYETLIRKSISPETAATLKPDEMARLCISAHFGAVWLDRCAPAAQDITTVFETLLKAL